tara:strand:+ start:544 stop:888 length:345 start_codon:yes stop_codon:yes gene_type:complete
MQQAMYTTVMEAVPYMRDGMRVSVPPDATNGVHTKWTYSDAESEVASTELRLVRLTKENVFNYIGCEIIFKTRGSNIVKRIMTCSKTGKTITIEHADLKNSLQIVSRKVYVLNI